MSNEALGERTNEEAKEVDARLKQYKNIAKHEDMRRRRTECSVEIRKQKRDDLMMKRRNLVSDDEEEKKEVAETDETKTTAVSRMSFPEVIAILSANPTLEQTREAFESVRRALSKSKHPPVDEVINCGLLHALVQALSVEDDKVRYEAAWAITNIVSGDSEQTQKAVEAGVTLPLVALTMHKDHQIAEQALWAVANIAGDSAQLRDFVIQNQGVEALMYLSERLDTLPTTFVRTLAWAFSNMCRHKNPHAPLTVLRVLSQGLARLIQFSDQTVQQDACWAVSYLTDGPDEQIELAREAGMLQTVVNFLGRTDAVIAPALRVLGNMATGNDQLTQCVIDVGTLKLLPGVVKKTKSSSIVKECCWLISNIIAGTQDQIQTVIEEGLLRLLVTILLTGDYRCQYECSWALANLAQGGTSLQCLQLFKEDSVPALCAAMRHTNADLINNILDTIYAMLSAVVTHHPERLDAVKESIEEHGGLDMLEKLQESENEKVYQSAYRIISEFFLDDDEGEMADENAAPADAYAF